MAEGKGFAPLMVLPMAVFETASSSNPVTFRAVIRLESCLITEMVGAVGIAPTTLPV